jgi:bleomycin hydrolase
MQKTLTAALAIIFGVSLTVVGSAQDDAVQYLPRYYDPVLEEMQERADTLKSQRDSITAEIRKRQDDFREEKKQSSKELRYDMSSIAAPDSPGVFHSVFHFPPVRQYRTGTCWSFSSTSFIESEVARQTGRRIKLSEMHTVYYEYLAKAGRYVRERGDTWNGEGSEANALLRMVRRHGAVPLEVYPGLQHGETRHDHSALSDEISKYLEFVKSNGLWDEDAVLAHVRLILNSHLGAPPAKFEFEGKSYTPLTFLTDVLKIKVDDYVDVMSTLSIPYFSQGPFEVPDNWWHDSSYYNVPLDQWYSALASAVRAGYSIELGGDVSEPGWYGKENLAVIASFDIPQSHINADSREFRFYNRTTTDDHGVHLVGHTTVDGRDWYLIKDSGSSARRGNFDGYFFMRDDYLRLKMLCFTVHKDAVRELLDQFPKSANME